MSSDEEDIRESLHILFGTVAGERVLRPDYGLSMQELLFEPMSTTMRTLVKDRVRTALLVHEPRIKVIDLDIASPVPTRGRCASRSSTRSAPPNSRFNLVFPFYRSDGNEMRASVAGPAPQA